MRSFEHPMGFPWLVPVQQGRRRLANGPAMSSLAALERQLARHGAAVFEQPEDRGAASGGP